LLLTSDVLDGIRAGTISVVFRCWKRPTVRAGGTLETAVGALGIDAVEPVALADVTPADAEHAGFASRAELIAQLRQPPRKLKQLGLTVCLEVGYRLSARGRALLRHLER
jgi:hypothetical protein